MEKQQLAQELSKVAIAGLAASAGLLGPLAGAGGAMAGAGLSGWIDRVVGGWSRYRDYLEAAQNNLLAMIGDDPEGLQALATALEAAKAGGITAREFARLDFDPEAAAAAVSERLGYHRLQQVSEDLAEQPLARRLLVEVYRSFLGFEESRGELNLAFQQRALQILNELEGLAADVRPIAEAYGWTGLLQIPVESPHGFPSAPARLLTAAYELLPYRSREQDAELTDWLNSDSPVAIRTVTAAGGVGKTRWLLQHCQDLDSEWRAGFLSSERPDSARYAKLFQGTDRLLVVIDYVEGRKEQFAELLDQAAIHFAGHRRIRIVALTRNLDETWWGSMRTLPKQARARDLIDADCELLDQIELQPLLPDTQDRQTLFRQSAERLAEFLGKELSDETPDLSTDFYRDPLFVQLAALNRILGGTPALDAPNLLNKVLDHEAGYWQKTHRLERAQVEPLLALITLWQGLEAGQGCQTIADWPNRDSTLHDANASSLIAALQRLYPDGTGGIAPLQPDRLGEALVWRVIETGEKNALLTAAFASHIETDKLLNAFRSLGRMTRWHESGRHLWAELFRDDQEALVTIGKQVHQQLQSSRDPKLARELLSALPHSSQALVELAAEALDLLIAELAHAPEEELAVHAEIARLKHNMSIRLAALGQRELALKTAQEAVGLYRELAERKPDAFRPGLAASLTSLTIRLHDLGQREPALRAAQEAVSIRRDLTKRRPDIFLPDLASSLNNLANCLSDPEQREPALKAVQEAVDIRRDLAKLRPDTFRPGLAASLNNLSSLLSALGQQEPALKAAQESVYIRRELAENRPDAFQPDLASSLNNLANRHSALGQWEPALKAAQEAVDIRRILTGRRLDAFLPNLVTSLGVLGMVHLEASNADAAKSCFAEGLERITPLLQALPQAFARLAEALARQYLHACEVTQTEPDDELLEPVARMLEQLQESE